MSNPHDVKPIDQPIRSFGRFFRSYGVGISLIISALPLATGRFNLLPQFEAVKPFLTAIASGSSFLLVGIIFAQRHAAARLFFPGLRAGKRRIAHARELRLAKFFSWLPATLGILALGSLVAYFSLVHMAERNIAYSYFSTTTAGGMLSDRCDKLKDGDPPLALDAQLPAFGDLTNGIGIVVTCRKMAPDDKTKLAAVDYNVQFPNEKTVQAVLKATPSPSVPYQNWMGLSFLFTFGCAASAFILTGLKDYLQREIGLSDAELIVQPASASRRQRFDVEGAPGVYGIAEYSPSVSELEPILRGPFCVWHDLEPMALEADPHCRSFKPLEHDATLDM